VPIVPTVAIAGAVSVDVVVVVAILPGGTNNGVFSYNGFGRLPPGGTKIGTSTLSTGGTTF